MRRAVIVLLAVLLAALSLGVAPAAQPRRIALVIDVSASMADAANGATKIEVTRQAVTAMLRFFAQTTPIPRVTVIAFSDDPTLLYPLSNNMDAAAGAVAALPDLVEGGTNIGAALEAALSALGDASGDGAEGGAIVLMTDGAPTQGLDAAQVIDGPARAAREQGHCFYTLGLGDFDAAFLESLRAVAPCPYAESVLAVEDTPRLLWAFTAIAHAATGGAPMTTSGALEPGASARLEMRVPGDQAELRVSVVSAEEAPELVLADPNGVRPEVASRADAPGVRAVSVAHPRAGQWSLRLRNPSEAATTYYVITSTLPLPINQTEADTLISILVAVVAILLVGIAVLAAERLRPVRPAALVAVATGVRYGLPRREGASTCIGSAPDATIVVAGAEVAPQHALIRYGRGRYYLQNQAEEGRTLLNGSPVSATPLIHGDRISVGGVEFVFQQEEREARSVVERTR